MRNGLSSCIQILAYLPALRLTPVLHQGSVAAPAKDDRHGKEPAIPRPMIAVTDRNFIAQDNVGGALLLLGNLMTPIHFQTAAEINSREPLQSGCPPSGARAPAQAVEQYQREVLPRISGLLAATYANLGA